MAAQKKSKKNHSRHYWQNHVRTHLESTLSRAEYCRRYNLSYHALSYWQRKLSKPSPLPTALVPVPDLNPALTRLYPVSTLYPVSAGPARISQTKGQG